MASGLRDPLGHNSWATRELFEFCAALTRDQLGATTEGTYGTILASLQHIVDAETGYRWRLSGAPGHRPSAEGIDDLGELSRLNDDNAAHWEQVDWDGFDFERIIHAVLPDEEYEIRAGALVAQVLNHGNEHRSQIFVILTTLGLEPPELDAWHYAEATGRFRMIRDPQEGGAP